MTTFEFAVYEIRDGSGDLLLRVGKVLGTLHRPFGTYFSKLTLFKIIPGRGNKQLKWSVFTTIGELEGINGKMAEPTFAMYTFNSTTHAKINLHWTG